MKAAGVVLSLLLLPSSLFAFDTNLRRGSRIAILDVSESFEYPVERSVARNIRINLARELDKRGFDAYVVDATYGDLRSDEAPDADYYIEIVSSDAYDRPYGGVGIGSRNIALEVAVVVARVAAHVKVYDGRSLEVIEAHRLSKGKTAIVPSAIGGAFGSFYAYIALPIIRHNMYAAAERSVARTSASLITGEINGSADRSDDGRS